MGYRVIIGRHATQDIDHIYHFIALDNPIAAASFTSKLLKAAKTLATFPERGECFNKKQDARFLVMDAYLIIYRIIEAQHEVLILRFWHAAREWRSSRL